MLPHSEQQEREETFAIALVLLFFVLVIFAMPFFTIWPDGAYYYQEYTTAVPMGTAIPKSSKSTEKAAPVVIQVDQPTTTSSTAAKPRTFAYYTRSKSTTSPSCYDRNKLTPIEDVQIFQAHGPGFALPLKR